MTTFKERARQQKVLRMRDLIRERAVFLGLPLTRTLDRMTPHERLKLDEQANIDRGFDPASADTWEELRTSCVRFDEVGEAIDRSLAAAPEGSAEPALEHARRSAG